MTDAMVGKWESTAMENMDALWDAMGVPEERRKAAREMKTHLEIARADGGGWKLVTSIGGKGRTVVFPLGQEVDTISLMREPTKAILTEDKERLVEKQHCSQGEITIRRAVVDGNMSSEISQKGVTAVVKFKRA